MAEVSGYRVASEKPLALIPLAGTLFTKTMPGAGNAGEIQWYDRNPTPARDVLAILSREQASLDVEEDRISSCSNACCTTARGLCTVMRDNRARIVGWLRCVAERAGLPVPPVVVRAKAAPPPSYWGLAGPRVFLGYPVSKRRTRETLPFGGPVLQPVLLTGPSAEAVLERMNARYRAASGHLIYVSEAERLENTYSGPVDQRYAVLDDSCGPGYIASLLDGVLRDGFPGEARIVALGCGATALAAMEEAVASCQGLGGCNPQYHGYVLVQIEVARWDGKTTGAIAGAGGTADVSAVNRSIGGCGAEGAPNAVRVGPISVGSEIDERACRPLLARFR